MTDSDLITRKIAEIAAVADQYPGVIILHNSRTYSVEYMSANGLALLQTTPDELRTLGRDYHARFFKQAEVQEYVPKIHGLLEQNDYGRVISFFQQVRTTQSPDWGLYFSTMRLLARGTDGLPLLLICSAHPVEPGSHVAGNVQRLLDENNFLRQHHPRFALLTAREREVLRELVRGGNSQEIAALLHISMNTADTHRRNIRQKLGTGSAFELGQYARAFNLI